MHDAKKMPVCFCSVGGIARLRGTLSWLDGLSGGLAGRLIAKDVLGMSAMHDDALVLALALVDRDRGETHVSSHPACLGLYRQSVAQFGT